VQTGPDKTQFNNSTKGESTPSVNVCCVYSGLLGGNVGHCRNVKNQRS
jgi:hypothetical protein